MRPQYLKDTISLSADDTGQQALRGLTKLSITTKTVAKFFLIRLNKIISDLAIGNNTVIVTIE
jgi:hypothetical protein